MKKTIYLITIALLCSSMPFVFVSRANAQPVEATVDIYPKALNLGREGPWNVTAYIEILDTDLNEVNVTTIRLNDTLKIDLGVPSIIDDYDNDTIDDLMVQFNRTEVSKFMIDNHIINGTVTLNLTGQFINGTQFEGIDFIDVKMPGDLNMDCAVNYIDGIVLGASFGSKEGDIDYDPAADENEDGYINYKDGIITGQSFGKTYP